MSNKSRREFLTKMGLTFGAITLGKNLMDATVLTQIPPKKVKEILDKGSAALDHEIDFRYAPPSWQSTYCFPDDPYKSLVGKYGELLYGHPGTSGKVDSFAHVVSIALKGAEKGNYVLQKMEAPSVPIITTQIESGDSFIFMTAFATNEAEEGRVDNLILELRPKVKEDVNLAPEILIKSKGKFEASREGDRGVVKLAGNPEIVFMACSAVLQLTREDGLARFQLPAHSASADKPLRYFLRFPQEAQVFEKIEDGLGKPDELLESARKFWKAWKPSEGKVVWDLPGRYQEFMVASARNILEAREIKNGKKIFQVGPTIYRGLWVVDGHFMLEAARYLGYDREAQEGLESIWDRQDEKGLITGGAGEAHWKDTAVAVYALIRQAELSQDWKYFNELYPDAYKGLMYLKELRDKAMNNGTPNGKYGFLPQGFGDSGIGGIRSELTNTIWLLTALKAIFDVTNRFYSYNRQPLREFYGEIRKAFYMATMQEMKKHPDGFYYLPMIFKDDPIWQDPDEKKRPKIQVAQIYLAHAIYPGLVFVKDDRHVTAEIELMKAVTKEDIPAETGWLSDSAVWTYNAAAVAQVYLWAGLPELARKTFIGFLNHASPLYAWREEQSLRGLETPRYIGDMPHNWASAECIRYLRHMMILEDEKNLRLFDGIGLPEMAAGAPMTVTYSPTRWGRVTVSLEPVDKKTWRTVFKREDFNDKTYSKIIYVEMPRKLPGDFTFDKFNGPTVYKNGDRVLIPAENTAWECTWRSF